MLKKVLFFFPHNPYPAKTGAHKRCLELLKGLKELGCEVTFVSSTYTSEQRWSQASIASIRREIGCDVQLHIPSCFEQLLTISRNAMNRMRMGKRTCFPNMTTVFMKLWFLNLVDSLAPEVIFINYIYFDSLFDRKKLKVQKSIIDMYDLVTLNQKMKDSICDIAKMKLLAKGIVPQEILDLEFFNKRNLSADKTEFEIYDKYDITVCISEAEKELVMDNTHNTKAIYLPMTHNINAMCNTYLADSLFCVGPNIFNIQGYYYFIYKLLPLIRERESDFKLVVTGKFLHSIHPIEVDGIVYKGFIDDLQHAYENSCFFICPVFGGTGQQVKIVEAMANGLPVVAFESAAKSSPLRNGVNGFVAHSPQEFCEHVLRLWNDRDLCRRLGEEARRTVAEGFNRGKLLSSLATIMS